jgi:transposase
MRGNDRRSGSLFSYVDLEARVAADHPLWPIRTIVDDALSELTGELEALYSHLGRPSIPPERLLRALLLQAFYSVRSERLLMEQLDYNLLYRWFVGLGIDDPLWHPTALTTNRDRLLEGEVAVKFLAAVLNHPRVRRLLSRDHFTIDGTLVEAWASLKSFRRKDDRNDPPAGGRNASRDLHGERRANDSHVSTTDPDARLFRKGHGKEARLCFMGHVLMENHHGLVVEAELTGAAGFAERRAAVELVAARAGPGLTTVGADRPTMPPTSSWSCVSSGPHRTSLSTPPGAARRSTAAPPGMPAIGRASKRGIGSRRCSPGSRPSPARARPSIAASSGCAGSSRSLRSPTT